MLIALPVVAAALLLAQSALAGTFVVNSPADTGGASACDGTVSCTLRQAIDAANALSDSDTITFDPGTTSYLIQPATALPQVTEPVVIDGSGTQVQIDGSSAPNALYGLDFEGSFTSAVSDVSVTGWNRGNGAGIKVGSGSVVTVSGSYLGTDWGQSSATHGNYSGIEVDGTATISGNNVEGNTTGLALFGSAVVHGSYFGPGGGAAGNSFQAILVQSSSPSIEIGGTNAGEPNQITGNGMGVRVVSPSTGVQILRNVIGALAGHPTNSGGGIVFGNDNGHTPNDTGDSDTGPNGLQNYPLLTGAYTDGSNLHVSGTLNSTASTNFTVELFVSASCNATGYGQGESFAGDLTMSTDASGNGSFSTASLPDYSSGVVTATATGPDGTSEFSNCVPIGSGPPQTFTVTSPSGTPAGSCTPALCTLPDAINAAADHLGPDTIAFDIPGGGVQTIPLGSGLDIGSSMTIDGTTQPGWAEGHPVIQLTGSGGDGLTLSAGQSTVRGLIINGFGTQIAITGGAGHTIAGNYLATDSTGTSTNGLQGVNIDGADDSLIGGTSSADRNVIGGSGTGVEVASGTGNVIEGNSIGLGPDGTTQNGAVNGVGLDSGGNTVGGTAAGAGNAIAVDTNGITVNSDQNVIEGNSIGTTADEAQVLGGDIGIDLESGTGNEIGVDVGTGNVIAGSADVGIEVKDGNNSFLYNFVGTKRNGVPYTTPNNEGIRQISGAPQNIYSYNTVSGSNGPNPYGEGFEIAGGAAAITLNTITGNRGAGVQVNAVSGIVISENSIDGNTGPGIELLNGGNDNLPSPSISAASITGSGVEVAGSLSGVSPNTTYQVQVFRSASCGSGSNPQGASFVGNFNQSSDGNGQLSFDQTFSLAGSGDVITATTLAPNGSTSAFSTCFAAATGQAGPTYTVNSTADPGDGACTEADCTLREAITAANADKQPSTIDFALPGSPTPAAPAQISLASPLPAVDTQVTIDGYSQPGASRNTLAVGNNAAIPVEVTGTNLESPNLFSFVTGSDGSTLEGLAINGDTTIAVDVSATGVTVAGNFIGTTADGTAADGILQTAVAVSGGTDVIGGPDPGDRNVLSNAGLSASGIDLNGAIGATVEGNYIGTDASGTSSIANGVGIDISGATGSSIENNLISGNQGAGVSITGASNNTIALNRIGTTADGTAALANSVGVTIGSNSTGNTIGGTLAGNTISGNTGAGVDLEGAFDTTISGNRIGTNAAGTAAVPNGEWGVLDSGNGTTIGGPTAGDRNLISGNTDDAIEAADEGGVTIQGNWIGVDATGNNAIGNAGAGIRTSSSGTISGNVLSGNDLGIYAFGGATPLTITGNLIGTNAAGTGAVPNASDGIQLNNTGSGVVIGGTATADRNLVSGNTGHGIHVTGAATGALIEGNYVGVDASGTAAIGNGIDGIALDNAENSTVTGNLSSGNTGMGISLFSGSSGNVVQGNSVGLKSSGSGGLPNFEGIRIDGASGNTIGAPATGEPPSGAANEVAFNSRSGIAVYGSSTGNSIRADSVHDNGELGIDLSLVTATASVHADGVTANDPGDTDTGPNNLQNFPDLAAAASNGASTEITGSLSSASGTYTLDFYDSPSCDGSGNGEGATWIGDATVTLDGTSASFDTGTGITGPVHAGDAITATATDANGNTSEFSACVTATSPVPKAGLSLTADEASIPAGAANVPLSSVPAGVLGQFAFAPVPNSPVPNSPVGASPVPNSPVPNSPVPNSPVPNSPVPNSPVANSGFDGISTTDLSKILLSSIPIDWSAIFAGTDYENVPTTGLTLADVYATPDAKARFEQLTLGQLQLQSSLLRGVRLESILFGGTKLEYIPPYTQAAWCAAIAPGSCADVDVTQTTILGLDVAGLLNDTLLGNLGKVTVGQITDPVAPVPNSPVPNSPVPNSPVPNSPVPNSALTLTAIGGVVIGDLYDPSLVVDCTKFSSTAVCLTKTLADAAALGAIKSTATFADILAPKTAGGPSPLANTNFNEFAIAMVGLDNLPWESWPIDGFQAFAGTGDVVHYHLTAPIPCGTDYSLRVILPHGFLVKPGTSTIVIGTGNRQTVGDPTQDAATGATWSTTGQALPRATGCTSQITTQPAGLEFQALAGFRLGEQTATAKLIVGTTTNTAVGQAPITVTQNNEPDDNPATAPAIQPSTLAIGHIASSSDLDWRSFSTAGLPAGTKIIVYLRPPAGTDLDLYLTKPGSLSLLTSPVPNSPVPNSPVPNSPVPNSPVPNSGDTLNRTVDNPPPEGLQDAPVPNSAIASEGITRGDATEVASVTLTGDETGSSMGIVVDGYNGAHSNDPYTLRVQVVKPPQLPACPARSFAYPSASVGTLPASIAADTQTLFLVNEEAMGRTYGQTAADGLMTRLDSFVTGHPELKAAVLPVDGDPAVHAAKAAWDASPCSIPAANDVVRKINALVARYRQTATGVQNIVIVGGDEQIPMARVPDGTTDANESSAAGDLLFTTQGDTRGNALFASEFLGNVLTDDAYAAGSIIPWFGGELDLPSMAVGRLVERPAEIEKQLDAYDASGGVLDPGSGILQPTDGVVTGYDFMTDEATQIAADLGGRLTGQFEQFIGDTWPNTAISPYFDNSLGHAVGILSVNAHYNHWELAPASPQPIVKSGLVDTTVLPDNTNGLTPTQLQNAILFTMGCHGGLNVSDTFPVDPGKEQELRDWAQALAQNGAGVYVANTGYGYGDYSAIALSEQLMTMFAHNLASDGTIGRKLMLAKQQYFGTIGTADPYAAKALQEATFYGLPFYAIGSRTEPSDAPPVATSPQSGVPGVATAPFAWPSSFGTSLQQHITPRGTYWSTIDNGVEYVDGRPIEPRADHEVTTNGGLTAHGVLIDSLTTHDTTVDPLIASPMIDNSAHEPELKVSNATFPAAFASVGHWTAFGKNHDELVFVPGQTRDGTIQRLVDSAGLDVTYSSSSDVTPPLFSQVGSIVNGSTATIFAKVDADPSGVALVRAFFTQGGNTWRFVDLTFDPASGLWTGTASGLTVPKIEAAFEAEDGAGNVAYTTDKGHLFLSLTGDRTAPEITIAAPIANGAVGLNQVVPAAYACSDEGGVASCTGTVPTGTNIDTSHYGPHSFTVTATDLSGNTSTVTVTYTVGYRFSGFFQPIDNPPIINVAKAGSAVPVKFSLGGNQGLAIFASGSPSTTQTGCDNGAPTSDVPPDPTDTAGKSGLSYDPSTGEYTYVWKTVRAWSGTCRRLDVKLVDGTVHSANFKFK